MNTVIAIDGPSGSGKSTIAGMLASRHGMLHVDSGALYRIITWRALLAGVDCADETAIGDFAKAIKIDSSIAGGKILFTVDGEEPKDAIRTASVNAHVSETARVPVVREVVTALLRGLRALGSLVVEGRDIGSVIFPDTPYRFYLDASAEERARRRHLEEVEKGIATQSVAEVQASLLNRDRIDSSRKTAPLKIANGACVLDTTSLSIAEVLKIIEEKLPPNS